MAPFVESWPASELSYRSQLTTNEKLRKDFEGDLKGCELFEMLQYRCEVEEPVTRASVTKCWPIQRLFRRCHDRKGTFTVETTAWEGKYEKLSK
ncbi:bromodomain associated protein [Diplocarpon rosae]|nr:bromodomain associated protein [Diplocarpon rosae]